ncbi:MAG: hypothetical protein ABR549_01025 [Mycobacteriales bacterium]
MLVRPARFVAGTLVLALPLVAAAGCGAAKKRSIKQELVAARSNLADSKAASFTLRLTDSKGALAALAAKDGDLPEAAAKDLLGGSVTYTFDAASASKLRTVDSSASDAELKSALADVHFAIAVKDAKTTVAEIRLVDSTLFARVNLVEVDRLAKEAGSDGVGSSVDDFIAGAPEPYQPALKDAKAGKWLKLPLEGYLDKIKDLTTSLPTPGPSASSDLQRTGKDLFAAVQPFIKVTDANNSSSKRVLNVDVDARPALKAALGVLKTAKELPFGEVFQGIGPGDIDAHVAPGRAHGTVTLADGHLTQVTVDVESIRRLDPHASGTSLAGSSVVLDVDDSAASVKAPTDDVSDVDVKALLDDLLKGFTESFGASLSGDVSS